MGKKGEKNKKSQHDKRMNELFMNKPPFFGMIEKRRFCLWKNY